MYSFDWLCVVTESRLSLELARQNIVGGDYSKRGLRAGEAYAIM